MTVMSMNLVELDCFTKEQSCVRMVQNDSYFHGRTASYAMLTLLRTILRQQFN